MPSEAYKTDVQRIVRTLAPDLSKAIDDKISELNKCQAELDALKAELGQVMEMTRAEHIFDRLARKQTGSNGMTDMDRLARALGVDDE